MDTESRILTRTLVAFVATAAIAVCAISVASAATHREDSPSPQHTVRDFLVAAVARHDGLRTCRYLAREALVDVHEVEPQGMSCEAAVSSYAHFELGGRRIDTEAQRAGRARAGEGVGGRRQPLVPPAARDAERARRVPGAVDAVADRGRLRRHVGKVG